MTPSLNEWRNGWRTLLGAMLGMSAGIGLFAQVQGFFVQPLQAAFGWSRGQVSLSSAAFLLTALAMPAVGLLVDRKGPRGLVILGAALFALAYVGLALMPGDYGVYLVLIGFIGLAAGPAAAPLVVTRPLVDAFEASRGLALAVGMSGSMVVSALILPSLQQVIAHYGWRAGYALMIPVSLIAGLAAFVLLRPRAPRPSPVAAPSAAAPGARDGHTLREALRDRRLWLLAGAIVCNSLVSGGFSAHLQPLLGDLKVPGPTAALIGTAFATSIIAGRILGGALLDRFWPPMIAAIALSAPVLGLLLFLAPAPSLVLMLGGATLVGLAMGAEGDVLAFLVARYFGLRSFGTIFGLLGLCFGVAMAGGAIVAGFVFDRLGDYHLVLKVGAGLAAASSGLILAAGLVRHPARPEAVAPREAADLAPVSTARP